MELPPHPPQAWLNWALMSRKVGWQLLALTGASQQAVPVWHPPLDHSWEAKPHAGTSRLGRGLLGPHCFIFCLFTPALCSIPIAPSPSPSPSPLEMLMLGRGLWAVPNYYCYQGGQGQRAASTAPKFTSRKHMEAGMRERGKRPEEKDP